MLNKLKFRFYQHRDTLLYTSSNVFLAAATFLGSFVCARLLLPEELGAFQTALLLVSYLGFLPLGVFNGFNRDFPYLIGRGEGESASLLARAGYSVARVAAAISGAIALGQFLYVWKTSKDPALVVAAVAVIPIAVFSQISTFQVSILGGRQSFGWIARTQIALAFVTLALLPLVREFTADGQAVRLVLCAAVPWIFYGFQTRDVRAWHWNFGIITSLIKRGLPILAIGYLYQIFSVADRTLIAWTKGTEAVGHYALAGLSIAAIQSVYTPLAVATYSKANRAFGQSHDVSALIRPVKIFLLLLSVSVVPIAVLIYFCLPIFVPRILPNYVEGIRAGQIACIASIAFCYCGTAFVFNVTGHNSIYGILMGSAVAAFFIIGFQIPKEKLTLERVAWLRAGICVCICFLTNAYLLAYFGRTKRSNCSQVLP